MKLGQYELEVPVFLAPLAGVTDKAFRETVCAVGGKYVWTEMISDKALTYQNSRTLKMLDLQGETEPRIVQLFGSEPETMARAALLAIECSANVIDINMGCPAPKIVKNGEGSALLRDLPRAREIASAVVRAVDVPVTVKIRLGWNDDEIVAIELAKLLESVGVQMLTVHGRTREQFYSGNADWDWIRRVKREVDIPVIGNGDVLKPEDASRLIEQTGCDGVMIGRGTLGNPWLIPRTQHFLKHGILLPEPPIEERIQVALQHFDRVLNYKGERIGLNEMRKHAVWYIKGVRKAAQLRDEIMQTKSSEEMRVIFSRILQ
ncbi:tRNA dihydrouridine synthase DusB [Desulfosporosinus sp. Sb-LF]|uniref:tRNA dihydrouridine synthase DusB n=1 Tax=Desulfosporosinus sp. Sb-LF TaxID=2560027 RepID=UPI00107F45E8|nr:tRNA dihydrouridine synthase DusB [Desulfosporosinus sp. Sb-LF]TGE34104.1 tRNA dihydrouridine synthase DusB [Desulfosporosinus sp. Sb-LF]